ncbi:MAG: hypothetical protein LUO80_07830 [Methylococcaceae bacterium]|jgi:hypothetical protein|nr:hypothetical protein [Methylococcaceae bacterium]
MNLDPLIETSLNALDDILIRSLGATATTFAARAEQVAATLTDDVAQPLRAIAALHARLSANMTPDPRLVGEFCFACGALHEKLGALMQTQMELESAIVGPESISTTPLQRSQSDQLTRLIETRDRLFRKVADLTLKFLLLGLGLLTLGLMLGVL